MVTQYATTHLQGQDRMSIRKVKCDEKKPACHRCTSTGRKCDGYTQEQPKKRLGARMLQPAPLSPPSSQSVLLTTERRALQYFYSVVSPRLSSGRDSYFWTDLVMQLSESELVVKHTVVSISSLFESAQPQSTPPYADGYALQHYTSAIQRLKALQREPLVLVACILFICVEYLQANVTIATQHCRHGLAIMDKCDDPWAKQYLAPVFRRLITIPMLFSVKDIENMSHLRYIKPSKFNCMEDALDMMDDIFSRVVRFSHMKYRGVLQDMEEEYDIVATHLETWQRLFEELEADPTSPLYEAQEKSLFMRLHLSQIELFRDDTPDEHMVSFRRVLHLAECSIQNSDRTQQAVAYTPMLFFVILKCSDLKVRLSALKSMQQLRLLREGKCEDVQMLITSRQIIQQEHGEEVFAGEAFDALNGIPLTGPHYLQAATDLVGVS
ncbi:putative transcriptional regulatory protein C15D4.02 [Fusarium austroafricanum]|uniref:Putative transcriptional regulatory protein C15D4.02 n=1 Tax=Fusarium austroafricanum TaxID=2364996 RepID=A0A8H4KBN5_9HYPO|nr:putative transcriptional regulatory protein C15D4.02 [Fusarium austroafricanum]